MRRRRLDIVLVAGGAAVLITSAFLAERGVYGWEVAIFQAFKRPPRELASVPLGGESIRDRGHDPGRYRRRSSLPEVAAGRGARDQRSGCLRAPAKVIKEYVARGRPASIVERVVEREVFSPDSLGYPSGHAAVAWAITIIVMAYVGRPWQIAAMALAIVVPLNRMYVGAHVPLDLIGGAALGVTVASAVNLLLGVPELAPSERAVRGQRDAALGVLD
jgi:PAP2 superfamily